MFFILAILFFVGCSKKEKDSANIKVQDANKIMLSPPIVYLPFSSETKIHHLNVENRLTNFLQKGGIWGTKKVDDEWVTIGDSCDVPAILVSNERLTKEAKKFVFDFKLNEPQKPFGLIYNNFILLITENNLSIYNIDKETDLPEGLPIKAKKIEVKSNMISASGWNSFGITTGFLIGTENLTTILYVNGEGIELPNSGNDNHHFGVFLAPNNKIYIKNFRWEREQF
jgi:hypothetical protein